MNKSHKRLPIPQWEFAFAPDTFNLIVETGIDGERITQERKQMEKQRQIAEKAQSSLFQITR
jgi:hypothetical protein